jgi:hypothetical protein
LLEDMGMDGDLWDTAECLLVYNLLISKYYRSS